MSSIFIIQLIISFFVGGGFVALLTFLAEKSSSKVSGIILSFPSTALTGFFFLAWSQSPEEVAIVVPSSFIPIGISVLFPVFYAYIANFGVRLIKKRILLIMFALFFSVSIWLLLALPLAHHKISHILFGITGYLVLISIGYFLLRQIKENRLPKHSYSKWQIIGRAVFVGFLVALIVFLGEVINPFWGAVLAMFPGALSCSIIIIHWYYGHENLMSAFKKVPVGSLSTFFYAITVMLTFPYFGFIWGTFIAFFVSLVTSSILSAVPLLNKSDYKL